MNYDSIFVGSGVLHVMEALHQKRLGKNVLIIDEKNRPFGAWGTITHPLFGEVETGCHVMERFPKVYDFLEDHFKIPLEKMNPSPLFIHKNKRIPYDWKWNVIILKHFLKRATRFKFNEFRKLAYENQWRLNLFQDEYKYPKGGSPAMSKQLGELVKKQNLEIVFNTKINNLIKTNSGWEIETSNGIFNAQNIQLTTLSQIQEIHCENRIIKPVYKPAAYHHMHLVVETKTKRPFSYLRLSGYPTLHRISDITNQIANALTENQRFWLVGINDQNGKPMEMEKAASIAVEILEKSGYCVNTKIIHEFHNSYGCHYFQHDLINEVKELPGITFLDSANFTQSIFFRLEDWKNNSVKN